MTQWADITRPLGETLGYSCETMGHDVETIRTQDGGIYRHGDDRFAWTYLPDGDLDPAERERFLLRERAFSEWLRVVHRRDAEAAR